MIIESFYLYLVLVPGFVLFVLGFHQSFSSYGRIIFLWISSLCLSTASRLMLNFRYAEGGSVAYVFQNIQATGPEIEIANAIGQFSIIIFWIGTIFSILEVWDYIQFKNEAKEERNQKKKSNLMEMSDRRDV